MKKVMIFASFIFAAHSAWACGKWRWSIKTGTDPEAQQINLSDVHHVQMSDLISLPLPVNPPTWNGYPQNSRIQPTEMQVYNIQVTIIGFRNEGDGDYHLIVRDASGNTMDTEIPNPSCVGSSSPFLPMIQSVRAYIDQHLTQTGQVNIPASITGVGFFDIPHAGGAAHNGVELHPILSVQFLNSISRSNMASK